MSDLMRAWGDPVKFDRKGAFEFIPTWQQGREQVNPHDTAKFLSEGYRHSLIYACIRERATSFADLPVHVYRPQRGGGFEPVPHQASDLLRNPSETMDGSEFIELLSTYYDAAGNAYIEKVRRSDSLRRNRDFGAVKELGLIRPDYVEIKPGNTRAEDVFVIKVQGTVVKVLPRSDVIHVKTPNPANDFYGLSSIAVILMEADLDTFMTQYDYAFFKNAGVPMGMIVTKTRMSPAEIKEVKGVFRRAYNGVKKWFEVMVMNADEAEYKQMGALPKDMEMVDTRNFVESRICSVFGVPPIVVGANVGLERSTYANYEQAQRSFWAETMIPYTRTVASALTRELLPEFATTADRGAYIGFGLDDVQALQEDNTDRLKVAAQLVGTGGWTVNEALAGARLPTLPMGDFYIRTIAQVVETPVTVRINGRVAATLVEPVDKAANPDRWKADRLDRERLARRAETALTAFLSGQADRAIGRLPKGRKVSPDALMPDSERKALEEALRPFQLQGIELGFDFAAAQLGLDSEFSPTDPDVLRLLSEGATRVTAITDTTRDQLRTILEQGRQEGWSVRQYRDAIRESGAFSASRAETIARTEVGTADNLGAAERYKRAGVTHVEVIDGDGDEVCATANGQRWTLEEANANPLAHPRCVRSFAPLIGE